MDNRNKLLLSTLLEHKNQITKKGEIYSSIEFYNLLKLNKHYDPSEMPIHKVMPYIYGRYVNKKMLLQLGKKTYVLHPTPRINEHGKEANAILLKGTTEVLNPDKVVDYSIATYSTNIEDYEQLSILDLLDTDR